MVMILGVFLWAIFSSARLGRAQQSVDGLQGQALANIDRANQIITYVGKMMEVSPTRESAERCVDLFLEAALLYGNAARFFKAMGPNYVPQDVVDRFSTKERECLKVVDDMRRQLNKGQVVGNNKETIQSLMQKLQEMSP